MNSRVEEKQIVAARTKAMGYMPQQTESKNGHETYTDSRALGPAESNEKRLVSRC